MVNLLGNLAAVLSHDVSALLDVCGVNNHIVFLMTHLIVVSVAMLVVDNIIDNMAPLLVMRRSRAGKAGAGEQKSCTNFIHYGVFLPTFQRNLFGEELKQTAPC